MGKIILIVKEDFGLSIKSEAKSKLSNHPIMYQLFWRLYHFFNFHSISKNTIKNYQKRLRLHEYFEVIFNNEIEYLRDRCRELEALEECRLNSIIAPKRFPKIDFFGQLKDDRKVNFGRCYVKSYIAKSRWAGLSADQAFYLEATSLYMLDSVREASQFDHFPFPSLIKISEQNLTVEMSHCGWSLDQLPLGEKPLKVWNYKAQVENIVTILVKSRVMHLDLRPDGKNLCVDREGNLSLIDFDIVVINDEQPLSWQIKRRAIKAKNCPDGYQTWAVNKINRAVLKYSGQLELL